MENINSDLLGVLIGKDDSSDNQQGISSFPDETPIAMAYVPFQQWEKPYDPETALCRGTLFSALDKPFIGEEAVKHG
ncbi:MAG: spore coat associated protein CotJA [Ruminococcus sp.]|nr:spore coat associated protein CotJA [Ruminococcus sp.]